MTVATLPLAPAVSEAAGRRLAGADPAFVSADLTVEPGAGRTLLGGFLVRVSERLAVSCGLRSRGGVGRHAMASDLRAAVGLRRAVETGTYRGDTARALATVFAAVVTIELSADVHRAATAALADVPSIRAVHGLSSQMLSDVRDPQTPTLFFLDGHWSGGTTAGIEDECPVLEELEALAGGHPDECLLIDDPRLFASAPTPPQPRDVADARRSLRRHPAALAAAFRHAPGRPGHSRAPRRICNTAARTTTGLTAKHVRACVRVLPVIERQPGRVTG
jgi:hypothetical protein